MSACVIVAFYEPCGYVLPRRHATATLGIVAQLGVEAVFLQVCAAGQSPMPVPDGVTHATFFSDSPIWLKENLWNIGASMTSADTLAFVDADVFFSRPDWLSLAQDKLSDCDILQPFEKAHWLDKGGARDLTRPASCAAIAQGQEPRPDKYHPGFAWCVTRRAFEAIGGWYERHPVGGADTAFAYSLDERWSWNEGIAPAELPVWESPSFKAHQRRALDARLRVGYVEGVGAIHRWHGDRADRGYMTRCSHLPRPINGEFPIRKRHDGLLEWETDEQSQMARNYFKSRREDG